jgi:hypothetical protein
MSSISRVARINVTRDAEQTEIGRLRFNPTRHSLGEATVIKQAVINHSLLPLSFDKMRTSQTP